MGSALVRTFWVGLAAAAALVVLSDLPIIGSIINLPGLNWVIWIGVWAWLSGRLAKEAGPSLSRSDNPSLPAMAGGALIGATSGLVGQLLQLVIQAGIVATTTSAARSGSVDASAVAAGASLSALGSFVALFLYPAFGAFWGGLFGLTWGGRVKSPPATVSHAATGTTNV